MDSATTSVAQAHMLYSYKVTFPEVRTRMRCYRYRIIIFILICFKFPNIKGCHVHLRLTNQENIQIFLAIKVSL
jgi:hypothetical protein